MVREDVEEERRDHRNGLLATDVACVGLVDEKVLEALESVVLADVRLGNVELPGVALGVPVETLGRAEGDALVHEAAEVGHKDGLDHLVERSGDAADEPVSGRRSSKKERAHGRHPVMRKVVGRGSWKAASRASNSSAGTICWAWLNGVSSCPPPPDAALQLTL